MSYATSIPAGDDESAHISFRAVVLKSVVAHTVTYFVVGWVASSWLDYGRWFAESRLHCFMRPISSPMVMAGPLFQPLRGMLFGAVFYGLRASCFGGARGWVLMWFVLVMLGIVNTFGASSGSIEGLIYTTLSWRDHVRGLPEVIVQSLLLSWVVFHWVGTRQTRWWNWVFGTAFVAALLLPSLGLLVSAQPH